MTQTVPYQRALFATQLPVAYRYTRTHLWLARVPASAGADSRWRVGYTRFGLRMIGELVDVQFSAPTGTAVKPGDIVGTIEGFKSLSDLVSVGAGVYCGSNAALNDTLKALAETPHDAGWLYEFDGEPEPRTLDVAGYCALLDVTIDRLRAEQTREPDTP